MSQSPNLYFWTHVGLCFHSLMCVMFSSDSVFGFAACSGRAGQGEAAGTLVHPGGS